MIVKIDKIFRLETSKNTICKRKLERSCNYTPHTLKFGFRYQRDIRDNKDFKDIINNKNHSKTEF
jgi:hypothetical protein